MRKIPYDNQRAKIAKRMRRHRKKQGLSLRDLGAMIKVCHVTIYNWDRGDSPIPAECLLAVAKALNTTPGVLLGVRKTTSQRAAV